VLLAAAVITSFFGALLPLVNTNPIFGLSSHAVPLGV
jgi:hypothetical protein